MPPTIELGEWHAAEPEAVAAVSPPRRRRRVAAIVVTAICFMALVGAAPTQPGLNDPLWTAAVSLAGFSLGTENLYLVEPGGQEVVGLRLATGERRWRLPITDLPDTVDDVGGGVAAVTTHVRSDNGWSRSGMTITLVDEATGGVRSRTSGERIGVTRSGQLIVGSEGVVGVDACAVLDPPCVILSGIDLATGRSVWRLRIPGADVVIPDSAGDSDAAVARFATMGPDRSMVIRDAATGATIDSVTLPFAVGAKNQFGADAVLIGGTVLTAEQTTDGVEVTAYALAPLRRRWSVVAPLIGPLAPGAPWFLLGRCGTAVCVQGRDGTTIIDPDSGRRLASLPGLNVLGELAAGVFLTVAMNESAGSNDASAELVLVDARTGETLATFPDSRPVPWADSNGRAMLMRQGPHRTEFTIVDSRGGARRLGSVAGADLTCQARSAFLACADPTGTLRVWRLPR